MTDNAELISYVVAGIILVPVAIFVFLKYASKYLDWFNGSIYETFSASAYPEDDKSYLYIKLSAVSAGILFFFKFWPSIWHWVGSIIDPENTSIIFIVIHLVFFFIGGITITLLSVIKQTKILALKSPKFIKLYSFGILFILLGSAVISIINLKNITSQ